MRVKKKKKKEHTEIISSIKRCSFKADVSAGSEIILTTRSRPEKSCYFRWSAWNNDCGCRFTEVEPYRRGKCSAGFFFFFFYSLHTIEKWHPSSYLDEEMKANNLQMKWTQWKTLAAISTFLSSSSGGLAIVIDAIKASEHWLYMYSFCSYGKNKKGNITHGKAKKRIPG